MSVSHDEQEEAGNVFSRYYSQLSHQQNMLVDAVRTTTYQRAIFNNTEDFQGSTVLDVGTGSGVLCFFSVQAGARKAYGVEMSNMAESARKLVEGNGMVDQISILKGKVEEVTVPEKVDIIVSEPLGFLLVHERMLESYIVARERFLKPGGKMFPTTGDIILSPFEDTQLFSEQQARGDFWSDHNFMGIDLTSLHTQSLKEVFAMPVVGYFHPSILLSENQAHKLFDFRTCTVEDLKNFTIPFDFPITRTGIMHGLAGWFDCDFIGTSSTVPLKTGPGSPGTHWYQCRLLFENPLAVNSGQSVVGSAVFKANASMSYDVHIKAEVKGTMEPRVGTEQMVYLQEQHYHYLYDQGAAVDHEGGGHVKGNSSQV
ncbi:hypothetical protein TrCOL_g10206 [Triparma columacea]|uniref:type I protein arginine methyltransferase n=1 Tax=Triparma columacea TaxID=722753 RepID=A0A9W7GAG3_9STRA|nr:hypothetical protein TrCOL_g10206 [Triparma columacea]